MSDFNNENNNLDPQKEEFDLTEILDESANGDSTDNDNVETDEENEEIKDADVETLVTDAVMSAAAANTWQREIYEWSQCIAIALIVAFIVNTFFFSVVRVDGRSMEDTLHGNERLVVTKFMYEPEFRDIVIVKPDDEIDRYLVKRVIGMPGDEIVIDKEDVFVNGQKLEESYIIPTSRDCGDSHYPVIVEEGCVFVMGDNRGNSLDSRFSSVGQIPFEQIYGKAVLRIWPFNRFGGLYGNIE